jgi:hypothetical protein
MPVPGRTPWRAAVLSDRVGQIRRETAQKNQCILLDHNAVFFFKNDVYLGDKQYRLIVGTIKKHRLVVSEVLVNPVSRSSSCQSEVYS